MVVNFGRTSMPWLTALFLLMVIFEWAPSVVAQNCPGDPIKGFQCSNHIGTTTLTGPMFAASGNKPHSLKAGQTAPGAGGASSADAGQFSMFTSGLATFDDGAEKRTPGYNSDTFGGLVGVNYHRNSSDVAVSLDYSNGNTNFDHNAGRLENNEFGIGLSGSVRPTTTQPLYLTGVTRFAYNDYDTKRNISGDEGNTRANGDPQGYRIAVAGGLSYVVLDRSNFDVTAVSSLSYEQIHVNSYKEHGARDVSSMTQTPPNLGFNDDTAHYLTSVIGLVPSKSFHRSWGILKTSVIAEYVHEFENNPRTIKGNVLGLVPGGTDSAEADVAYRTNSPDRNYFNLGASITATVSKNWQFFLDYNSTVGNSLLNEQLVIAGVQASLDAIKNLLHD